MVGSIKDRGQVYTPIHIVRDVLDVVGYTGIGIVGKHVMENSCGQGAFLLEVVRRYIETSIDTVDICSDLGRFIHGIDIDPENVAMCRKNLDELVSSYGLPSVDWDIRVEDALNVHDFDGRMDFVVGNPPYVRIHNLKDLHDDVKRCAFGKIGMTDLYLAFYELGLRMLKSGGKLGLISSNSFFTSQAGVGIRKFIAGTHSCFTIWNLGHYNPFSKMTYTAITAFEKDGSFDCISYAQYDPGTGRPGKTTNIPYSQMFIDGRLVPIEDEGKRKVFRTMFAIDCKQHPEIKVRNGFCINADPIFIHDSLPESDSVIDVCKASTGQWKRCIFPYDEGGKLLSFDELDSRIQGYLLDNRSALTDRSIQRGGAWYSFGRHQAVADVSQPKIAVNPIVKGLDSIRLTEVGSGKGVYNGLYIITDHSIEEVRSVMQSRIFLEYVQAIGKCRNSGYYTFSAEDLNKFLIAALCDCSGSVQMGVSLSTIQSRMDTWAS